MKTNLLRLYPASGDATALNGLYLSHQIHTLGTQNTPFVYANFLSSLDGRIALEDTTQGTTFIPKHITSASDFRLFKELQAQSDCLITHGGYLRALNKGLLGNILQIRDADLLEYRRSNGLPTQPVLVIASATLDFPMHPSIKEHAQSVYIATGKAADPERVAYWQAQGYSILFTGEDKMVHGKPLINALQLLGCRSIYLIAGPQMLDTMIRDKQLARLYLTITHQLVGGQDFRSLLTGPALGHEGNMILKSMYYEQNAPTGSGQFFLQFDIHSSRQ
jgi:riboflavin biosynthesis pyrimidine reductase